MNGAKAELDTAKRTKMLVDAEKILMQEMPIAPNYFRTQAYLVKPNVKGLILPPMGGDFELKWAAVAFFLPIVELWRLRTSYYRHISEHSYHCR